MTTINLYQSQQEKPSFTQKNTRSGFIFSLGILIITLLSLAGLKIAVYLLEQRNEKEAEVIKNESSSLAGGGNIDKIIDMQTRIDLIKNNLVIKDKSVNVLRMSTVLDDFGSELNPSVAVSAYKFEAGKISAKFDSANYYNIAQQILNFKKSDHYTGINVKSVNRGEKGITCEVEMILKS